MQLARDLSFQLPLMTGYDVRAVQQSLILAGTLKNGGADGIFGPGTRDAVLAFQKQAHARDTSVVADGVVGRSTWSMLFAGNAPNPEILPLTVPRSLATPTATAGVSDWQRVLKPYAERIGVVHEAPKGSNHNWQLTPQGVRLNGDLVQVEGGASLAAKVWQQFRAPFETCAAGYGVPVELLVATACTESSGDPMQCRLEPGYVSDQSTPGKVSPGLMQTLLSTARDCLHNPGLERAQLFDAPTSARAAALLIRQQADRTDGSTGFDPPLVGIAYNAGSLRQNTDNPWGLIQTARPPLWHADVFTGYFNHAFEALSADAPHAATPSFFTLLNT